MGCIKVTPGAFVTHHGVRGGCPSFRSTCRETQTSTPESQVRFSSRFPKRLCPVHLEEERDRSFQTLGQQIAANFSNIKKDRRFTLHIVPERHQLACWIKTT